MMKVRLRLGDTNSLKKILRKAHLRTVCEESRCPNIGECFKSSTATFMILGKVCTRNCAFCNIKRGKSGFYDPQEPKRILQTAKLLGLKYVVITSVSRDDLKDMGASVFAECVRLLKEEGIKVEVLVPDFKGKWEHLERILREEPEVLNHNLETVKRLYPKVRRGAHYERSLELLRVSKEINPRVLTKSALILGFGESLKEVFKTLEDLKEVGCDLITVGQYYQPSLKHYPVKKYYSQEEFKEIEKFAKGLGFKGVVVGPNVRSSYKAYEVYIKNL